jgi:hypothetical protein
VRSRPARLYFPHEKGQPQHAMHAACEGAPVWPTGHRPVRSHTEKERPRATGRARRLDAWTGGLPRPAAIDLILPAAAASISRSYVSRIESVPFISSSRSCGVEARLFCRRDLIHGPTFIYIYIYMQTLLLYVSCFQLINRMCNSSRRIVNRFLKARPCT